MSSVDAVWQDAVVEVRVEGRSLMAASTGSVNENLNGTAAVIGRKILCIPDVLKHYFAYSITLIWSE